MMRQKTHELELELVRARGAVRRIEHELELVRVTHRGAVRRIEQKLHNAGIQAGTLLQERERLIEDLEAAQRTIDDDSAAIGHLEAVIRGAVTDRDSAQEALRVTGEAYIEVCNRNRELDADRDALVVEGLTYIEVAERLGKAFEAANDQIADLLQEAEELEDSREGQRREITHWSKAAEQERNLVGELRRTISQRAARIADLEDVLRQARDTIVEQQEARTALEENSTASAQQAGLVIATLLRELGVDEITSPADNVEAAQQWLAGDKTVGAEVSRLTGDMTIGVFDGDLVRKVWW